MNQEKKQIIDLFIKNVKGKKEDTSGSNQYHDGKGGHWLERQMGITANNSNSPDILGYEMKNDTTSKTSFGDWSPDKSIFKTPKQISRDDFLTIFGKSNQEKNGRFSWSGDPSPKIGNYNSFGQILKIDDELNIHAVYSYSKDMRQDKNQIVPIELHQECLILATWTNDVLRKKVENKFNQKGWFKCLKNKDGYYNSIVFCDPFGYEHFIELVKKGIIFFDSGMHQGNPRPYANWRANNSALDEFITSTYQ
jgi:hypothetical protein